GSPRRPGTGPGGLSEGSAGGARRPMGPGAPAVPVLPAGGGHGRPPEGHPLRAAGGPAGGLRGPRFQPLTHEILCECLSQIKQVVDGGFAFTRLDGSNKELTNLGNKVENYKQLQHIVLSSNKLVDIGAVTKMPHLLTLQIDSNEVTSLECMQEAELPWCQRLNLSSNKLEAVMPLAALTRLRFLNLSANAITSLEGFGGHPALEQLELQENQLTTLKGMGPMGSLKVLNLSGNQLTSLEGLSTPCLESLDVSSNQLASLEHVGGAPMLTALNLQGNQFDAEDPQLPELRR
ncbi:unnamed protein product, partial [Prorocentrum cordatum]